MSHILGCAGALGPGTLKDRDEVTSFWIFSFLFFEACRFPPLSPHLYHVSEITPFFTPPFLEFFWLRNPSFPGILRVEDCGLAHQRKTSRLPRRRRELAPRGKLHRPNHCCSPLTPLLQTWDPFLLRTGAGLGRLTGRSC